MKELIFPVSLMYERWKAVFWALSQHFIHSYIKNFITEKYKHIQKQRESVMNPYVSITQLQQLTIHIQSCFIYFHLLPLPLLDYFKAHPTHYINSSVNVLVCLPKFKT